MTDTETRSFEDQIIAEMRGHDGKVTTGPLTGHPILVMTSTGARSGQERRALLTFSRDGEDYIVAGTAGGSPIDPAWMHNLIANPQIRIEAHNRTFDATASVAEGEERDRLWRQHVEALPWFADYPAQTGRVIPMFRLIPQPD
jgi:deazaflavin-dependent oxidoreductase (nitroreductase family)